MAPIDWASVAKDGAWITLLAAVLAGLGWTRWRRTTRLGDGSDTPSSMAHWVTRAEPWLLLLASPLLMLLNRFTPVALPLLVLPWLTRKATQGRWTAPTPLDVPMLLLLAMVPVGVAVSADAQRSLLKLYGIALGAAVLYGIVNQVKRPAQAAWVGFGMALVGLPVSVLALMGTAWPKVKLFDLPWAYGRLPDVAFRFSGLIGGKFNANEVGAVLCLVLPLAFSLLFLGGSQPMSRGNTRGRLLVALLSATLLLMLVTLLLVQSRAVLLGVGAGLLFLACFRSPRLLAGALLAALAATLVWHSVGQERLHSALRVLSSERNVSVRIEVWQRALWLIRDSPVTGVGLNTFALVASSRYPFNSLTVEEALLLTHAHNVFLQVAVDVGIPGLVAYLAVLLGFGAAGWSVCQHFRQGPLRALGIGLLGSMLAYHVFGLIDCMTLGAKPGVLIWAMWGLMAALANMADADRCIGRQLRDSKCYRIGRQCGACWPVLSRSC